MVLFFLIYFSCISPNRYYNKFIRQKKTFYSLVFCYFLYGDCMKVKVFDENHEKDLESDINEFLNEGLYDIIDVRYQVAIAMFGDEQLYCFSALLLYEEK